MGFLHFLLRDPADPADPILPGAVRRRAAAVTAAAVTAAVEGRGLRGVRGVRSQNAGNVAGVGWDILGLWCLILQISGEKLLWLCRCMGNVVVLGFSLMFKTVYFWWFPQPRENPNPPRVHFDVQIFSLNPVEMGNALSALDFLYIYIPSCNIAIQQSSWWGSINPCSLYYMGHVLSDLSVYIIYIPTYGGYFFLPHGWKYLIFSMAYPVRWWNIATANPPWKSSMLMFPFKTPISFRDLPASHLLLPEAMRDGRGLRATAPSA